MTKEKKRKFWRYGIGFLIIGIGVSIVWWWKHFDCTEPVYQWFQNISEDNLEVVSFGKIEPVD
ncbi:MAG: hypothetical protein HFI34_08010 [Lachnospiraceae bacterium]|nr:hypothetical protein [Lachnospiraceae bacterium]